MAIPAKQPLCQPCGPFQRESVRQSCRSRGTRSSSAAARSCPNWQISNLMTETRVSSRICLTLVKVFRLIDCCASLGKMKDIKSGEGKITFLCIRDPSGFPCLVESDLKRGIKLRVNKKVRWLSTSWRKLHDVIFFGFRNSEANRDSQTNQI